MKSPGYNRISKSDAARGGGWSACIFIVTIVGSVAILGAAGVLAWKIIATKDTSSASDTASQPLPDAVSVPINSTLEMALLFILAQKSGALPSSNPITWRGGSGLTDGEDMAVDLTGGFYVKGDHVKYNFPIAFTVTVLAWSLLEYGAQYQAEGTLAMALDVLNWGTDYLVRCHPYSALIFTQVSDLASDSCWIRPEDISEPRPSQPPLQVTHPGSDLAGEMAAAFAAASLVFRPDNATKADALLAHASDCFTFADQFRGRYSDYVTGAQNEYKSTSIFDELLWGATWLYLGTGEAKYLTYVTGPNMHAWKAATMTKTTNRFSWDMKLPAMQVLLLRVLWLGFGGRNAAPVVQEMWAYKPPADAFMCQFLPNAGGQFPNGPRLTPGGMVFVSPESPMQYVVSTAWLALIYSDYLAASGNYITCPSGIFKPVELALFAKSQLNYIYGANPMKMSYMVGYGGSYPLKPHHMGSSIPSFRVDDTVYDCDSGRSWLSSSDPNPNLLVGALVGGPSVADAFNDARGDRQQSEPSIYTNALLAGVIAGFTSPKRPGMDYIKIFQMLDPAKRKYALKLQAFLNTQPPAAGQPAAPAAATTTPTAKEPPPASIADQLLTPIASPPPPVSVADQLLAPIASPPPPVSVADQLLGTPTSP
eukprot:SM000154S01379  [mRNA]  locus=s154:39821:43099:- [translate_table: standard]